ncbi:MAG: hypothetical protein MUC50_23285 [Myxococcota bacterium]|nr:hypothetical protein [Myxococcota bacterium]
MTSLPRHVHHLGFAFTALLVLLIGSSALAGERPLLQKDGGGELRLFRSAVDTKGHFTVDATPMLPHLNLSLSLVLDFGFNQWIAVEADRKSLQDGKVYKQTMVQNYISSVLAFNFGLFNRVIVGASVPLLLPSGTAYNYDFQGERKSSGWSTKGLIGDIGIHTKVSILRADQHPVGVGAVLAYKIPVGKRTYLAGEKGGGALSGKVIFDMEPSKWYRFAINAGAHLPFGANDKAYLHNDYAKTCTLVTPENPDPDKPCSTDPNARARQDLLHLPFGENSDRLLFNYGPQLTFGLGQSVTLWPDVMDLVIEVYGNQIIPQFGDLAYMALEANVGLKVFVERNSYLMAGYAHGIPLGATTSGYGLFNIQNRMFIGFAFEPSPMDRDGDGIPDYGDACPDEPEDKDGFEDRGYRRRRRPRRVPGL